MTRRTRKTGKKISHDRQREADDVESFTLSSPQPKVALETEKIFEERIFEESAQSAANTEEDVIERIEETVSAALNETPDLDAKPDQAVEAINEDEKEMPTLSVGALLRQARDAAGLTVDSVAVSLKLASRQIAALENDEYEKLPARTFVRGFVRNYARLLNIDPNMVLAALPPESQTEISPAAISVKCPMSAMPSLPADNDFPRAQRKIWRWLVVLIVLALFFVVLLFKPKIETWLEDLQKEAVPETAQKEAMPPAVDPMERILPPSAVVLFGEEAIPFEAPPLLPMPAESAETTVPDMAETSATTLNPPLVVVTSDGMPPLPGDAELEMIFDDQSWLEVRDADNKSLFYGLAQAGEQKKLYGKAPLSVVLGKGEAVRINFRGHPVDFKTTPNTTTPNSSVIRLMLE